MSMREREAPTVDRDRAAEAIGKRIATKLEDDGPLPFQPIGKFVAIRVHKVNETPGGIVVPDTARDDAYQTPTATVLATGPDCKQVKVGDVVVAPASQPCYRIKRGRVEFILINEEHLFGVWTGPT